MSNIVIAAAKRTAIGSFLGQFNGVPTPTLGAAAIAAALEQSGIPASDVSEVLMGCVLPANLGQAPARQAAIAAGIPLSTGATTLNKVCGSGMKTIMLGHDLIKAGSASIVVAGGMESMSNAPHMLPNSRTGNRFGNFQAVDHMAHDGLVNAYDGKAMGEFAECAVDKYQFSREEQDAYAIESVKRAQAAQANGAFADEIVAVKVATRKGEVEVTTDEQPGRSDIAKTPDPASGFQEGRQRHRRQFLQHLRRRRRCGPADRGRRSRAWHPPRWPASSATPPTRRNRSGSPPPRSARCTSCWTRPAGRWTRSICLKSTKPLPWWRWRRCANWASRMTSST
jgi:Acetyl-CoA acetyltransferase